MLRLVRRFASEFDHKKIHQQLRETTQKVKHKQTAADLKGVQSFIRQSVYKGRMTNLINKTARLDSKFDAFMNNIETRDKIPETIDFGHKHARAIKDGEEVRTSK